MESSTSSVQICRPGVPSSAPTASWVPLPLAIAYATGVLLIAFGTAMFAEKYAAAAAARAGLLMTVLTAVLYVPQFFLAARCRRARYRDQFHFRHVAFRAG